VTVAGPSSRGHRCGERHGHADSNQAAGNQHRGRL
jgi:hypothetical protein